MQQDKVGYIAHGTGELSPPEPNKPKLCTACGRGIYSPEDGHCITCFQMNSQLEDMIDELHDFLSDTIDLRKYLENTADNPDWECAELRIAEKHLKLALDQLRECKIV